MTNEEFLMCDRASLIDMLNKVPKENVIDRMSLESRLKKVEEELNEIKQMHKIIRVSTFVQRQTRTSEFSYYKGSWESLEKLTYDAFKKGDFEEGYRDGVILVNVKPFLFRTSVVKAENVQECNFEYSSRRKGEEPFMKKVAYGEKSQAVKVQIVLYHQDVLKESGDLTLGSEWEIISINASPYDYDLPMMPLTMARNQLEEKGGTKGYYTSEQYAEAILFWSKHCTVRER